MTQLPDTASAPARMSWFARLAPLALAAAAVLLFFGWTLPMLNVTSFWVFHDAHSVIGGIQRFWEDGEWLLLLAIGGFAVAFPAAKIAIAGWAMVDPAGARTSLKIVHMLSKWSMLDVFVVALVVLTVKSNAVADASVGPGAWCFAGAAIASSLAIAGLARRIAPEPAHMQQEARSMNLSTAQRVVVDTANAVATLAPALWAGVILGAGMLAVPAIFAGDEAGRIYAYTAAARVFTSLGMAEWAFALALVVALIVLRRAPRRTIAVAIVLMLVATQAIWLRPELVERANALAAGQDVPPSPAHAIFAVLEVCKLAWLTGLAIAGWRIGRAKA